MSDVDVVREIYDALAAKDVVRLVELLDPSIVLDQDPALPWGGHYEGHEGFADFAAKLTGTIDSKVATEFFFEADGEVFQAGRTQGTVVATGAPFDVPEVHRWRIQDGKAVKADFAIDTPRMLDALTTR
jgi:ketosteroid isomerase-like protein